ncbi:hypothetical protein AB4142_34800, partial [Variovorax sp. 2RAF20]
APVRAAITNEWRGRFCALTHTLAQKGFARQRDARAKRYVEYLTDDRHAFKVVKFHTPALRA